MATSSIPSSTTACRPPHEAPVTSVARSETDAAEAPDSEREICRVLTPIGEFCSFENDGITHQLERFGAHQRNELAMIRSRLRAGDRVLDIGAHIGTFAVPLARWIGAAGQLDAFEAEPRHYALLRENLRINFADGRAAAHHLLIGSDGGAYHPCSMAGNSAETWFEPRAARLGDEPGPEVSAVALDTWWRQAASGARIDFLKVDVEGMEPDVLGGGGELLATHRPVMYLEVHPRHLARRGFTSADLESPLRALGYHFFRNLGRRNSRHDRYVLGRLRHLPVTGSLTDVLAVPADSDRYPRIVVPAAASGLILRLRQWLGRLPFRRSRHREWAGHLW